MHKPEKRISRVARRGNKTIRGDHNYGWGEGKRGGLQYKMVPYGDTAGPSLPNSIH